MIIERTTERGYDSKTVEISEALEILNADIEEGRQLWMDSRPFMKQVILEGDIKDTKKISVTNKLVGG